VRATPNLDLSCRPRPCSLSIPGIAFRSVDERGAPSGPTLLEPNHLSARCVVSISAPRDVFCKFTFNASKTAVHAVIETLTTGGTTTAALPAS
jgi:hypothetical protein